MHPPKDDTWPVCVLKYDTKYLCLTYKSDPDSLSAHPGVPHKDFFLEGLRVSRFTPFGDTWNGQC